MSNQQKGTMRRQLWVLMDKVPEAQLRTIFEAWFTHAKYHLLKPEGQDGGAGSRKGCFKPEVLSAALMITFSLFLVLVFGDPLVNTLETLGNELGIPEGLVFMCVPIITSGEVVQAILWGRSKKQKEISMVFGSIFSAVAMNNCLVLGAFLLMLWQKELCWSFGAECSTMLFTCGIIGLIGSWQQTHNVATGLAVALLYPVTGAVLLLLEAKEMDETTDAGLPFNSTGVVTVIFAITAIPALLLILRIFGAECLRCANTCRQEPEPDADETEPLPTEKRSTVFTGFGSKHIARVSAPGDAMTGLGRSESAEQFRYFDRDGDRGLNVRELSNACSSLGIKLSSEECKAMIADIDHDHSGTIDYKEFSALFHAQRAQSLDSVANRDFVRNAFLMFAGAADADAHGDAKEPGGAAEPTINLPDLQAIRQKLGYSSSRLDARGYTDDMLMAMIDEVDEDGDKEVTSLEFAQILLQVGLISER